MPPSKIEKYGATWPLYGEDDELKIEMEAIRLGGKWTSSKTGKECGMGLPFHYERMREILWPHLDGEKSGNRWHVQARDAILANTVTVLMGCASSAKTHSASWIFLCEYFCYPQETCILVSSTSMDTLKMRVWAEIQSLWSQAVRRFDWLPGHLLDSKVLISTDNIAEKDADERVARDWRKGIKGVPCVQNGTFVGLARFIGIKQKRMRLIADEAQQMGPSFLSAFSNLQNNISFKAVVLGNPNDTQDPLGKAAEPTDGWQNHMEPEKTAIWKTRFMAGTCVNFIGTDSPNYDFPDEPIRFPYLNHKKNIENTRVTYGDNTYEYYSQAIGSMKISSLSNRVLTRDMIRQFKAQDDVIWLGTPLTRIFCLDTSYGGDRCVGGSASFGDDNNKSTILSFDDPFIIPISADKEKLGEPEYQIARAVRKYCDAYNIPPQNMFHDSTGRGALGTALAVEWSNKTNPVDFGGKPTERPVTMDLFVTDEKTKQRRLMRCDEYYDRFVSELWGTVRWAVEASQIRNLPEDAAYELCSRLTNRLKGKFAVEVKDGTKQKPGYKQRMGKSPDMGDWACLIVEAARRKGFSISRLSNEESTAKDLEWLAELRDKAEALKPKQLSYA